MDFFRLRPVPKYRFEHFFQKNLQKNTRLFLLSVQLIGSADGSFSACQGERVVIYRKCIGAIPCCPSKIVGKINEYQSGCHRISRYGNYYGIKNRYRFLCRKE